MSPPLMSLLVPLMIKIKMGWSELVQDVTAAQFTLLQRLTSHRRITVVGDDDQVSCQLQDVYLPHISAFCQILKATLIILQFFLLGVSLCSLVCSDLMMSSVP